MKKLICNYNVIRFLPYPETREFVNIGILACCPQVGWMDYVLEPRKTKRISDFFPELEMNLYRAGRKHLLAEMDRFVAEYRLADTTQWQLPHAQEMLATFFAEIIRPREEIFRFGEPATLLTHDPVKDLKALFNHYVDRHFAHKKDYQETLMTERVKDLFKEKNIIRYRPERVGTDEYHVTLPFVARADNESRPARALKPLNLNQSETTDIFNHGDAWRNRIERLGRIDCLPRHMLFAVQCPPPEDRKRFGAAKEICDLLTEKGMEVTPFENQQNVTRFACAD